MDTKRLHELMSLPGLAQQWADVCVYGVSSDSRQVEQGNLFITCLGEPKRQRSYIEQAQANGAAAVAIDAQQALKLDPSNLTVPIVGIANLAVIQGSVAAKMNNEPSQRMSLVGITGTNGKTSCSQFIAQCFTQLGQTCGVMGTLGYGLLDQLEQGLNTTPDEVTMQSQLGAMADAGAKACAVEVSSHGLDQGRLNGCRFKTAVFTNLTRDHLDYHGSMRAYGEVKAKLFVWPNLSHAVINFDDDFGRGLLNEVAPSVQTYTYSAQISEVDYVDVGVSSITQHKHGIEALVHTPMGTAALNVGLIGRFNLSNILASLAVLLLHGVKLIPAMESINNLTTVSGRMQLIGKAGQLENAPQAIVDYAHTPDALEQALIAAKEHITQGELWVVFGCGGDRDAGKRPQMASIAERFADHVVVTDDNPRTESSEQILQHIARGFSRLESVIIESDRSAAIKLVMGRAKACDIVLIAGKGHETYQDIQGHKHHFSDQEQVHRFLQGGAKA
ncbi:MAG: UDP-N-acetylmuramoyl-L-alanyl-D-glutamate--2,6-diaminopimelate ligase [Gammaproteobacteria bacterium]|nr:UDP-N-acetylmuramoyl-L-alanyl-D-glutamate--2,6-diaminopimelate ligase [Gammaproteobacteria bacterium]